MLVWTPALPGPGARAALRMSSLVGGPPSAGSRSSFYSSRASRESDARLSCRDSATANGYGATRNMPDVSPADQLLRFRPPGGIG